MPTTNRPFFANFFSAFRAQSYFQKAPAAAVTATTTASSTASPHATYTTTSPSHSHTPARPISTKAQPQTTSSTAAAVAAHAAATFQSARSPRPSTRARQHSTSPVPGSRSPGPRSPAPYSPPHRGSFQRSRTPSETRIGGRNPQRRGSDSSGSDGGGLKDMVGSQGWYIGGRTPGGEERFYRLGMVKRWSSADRLSLDRLSL